MMRAVGVTAIACVLAATAPLGAAGRSAQFKVTAVQTGQAGQVTMVSNVWVTASQARADLKHPLGGDMTVLLTNGAVYQLDKSKKQGVKSKLPPEFKQGKDNFDFFIRSLAFNGSEVLKSSKKVGTETVAGYVCDIYRNSESRGDSIRTLKVWMPQKMQPRFALKANIETAVDKPGVSLKETLNVTLSNLKLNQPIAASVFAVPAGYKIVEGKIHPPGKPK